MESKTKELVKAGHELVVLLGNQHGMIDAASLVQRLTAQLDITAAALREKSKVCDQLAAENAAQREYRPQPSGAAMMEALDAFYEYHEDVPEQGMMAAFEILCCKRPQALATDAWQREQMARGVDAAIAHLHKKFEGTGHIGVPVMALEHLAQQLRNGEAV